MRAELKLGERLQVLTGYHHSGSTQVTDITLTGEISNLIVGGPSPKGQVRFSLCDDERKALIGFLKAVPDNQP